MKNFSVYGRLTATSSLFALALTAGTAHAQNADPTATDSDEESALETIVVTGSRIARPEVSFPNPVQTLSAENFEQSGETNLTDYLLDSPALSGSLTGEQNAGSNTISVGVNLLNLRNLGTARTLVLINGRRHVNAFPGENSVDTNTIPVGLVERIDILTGGVSAIYGADGVSGVVNFVLKRKFEGLSARGQIGISEQGDAGNRFGSIILGKNFADDRGNITVAYEYDQSDRLNERQRAYTGDPARNFQLLRDFNDFFLDDPNVPDRILVNNVSWADSSPNGAG